eukprot:gene11332-biopygen11586
MAWDELLSEELKSEWTKLLTLITRAHKFIIPRYYFGAVKARPREIELFGFCDSSEQTYAAAVYANSQTNLVMSKSRVAPLTKMSIPRLELLSALILARLIVTVNNALSPICHVKVMRCWTDSITTLHWIRGDAKEW